jgi:hypothetical protein
MPGLELAQPWNRLAEGDDRKRRGKRAVRLAAGRLYREILDTDSRGYGGGNVGRPAR